VVESVATLHPDEGRVLAGRARCSILGGGAHQSDSIRHGLEDGAQPREVPLEGEARPRVVRSGLVVIDQMALLTSEPGWDVRSL
jgi:hypothetical protein